MGGNRTANLLITGLHYHPSQSRHVEPNRVATGWRLGVSAQIEQTTILTLHVCAHEGRRNTPLLLLWGQSTTHYARKDMHIKLPVIILFGQLYWLLMLQIHLWGPSHTQICGLHKCISNVFTAATCQQRSKCAKMFKMFRDVSDITAKLQSLVEFTGKRILPNYAPPTYSNKFSHFSIYRILAFKFSHKIILCILSLWAADTVNAVV